MFAALIALAGAGLVALVGGGAWALAERGVSSRREGAEIGAELMAARAARSAGRTPLAGRSWFAGRGWAVERTAEYTAEELVARFRARDLRPLAPGLLAFAGFVLLLLSGGLALTVQSGIPRWIGLALLAALVYGLVQLGLGLREAARAAPRPGSASGGRPPGPAGC